MPKRSREEESYHKLERKLRKLEKKLKRRSRSRHRCLRSHSVSSRASFSSSHRQGSDERDCNEMEASSVTINEPIASTSSNAGSITETAGVAPAQQAGCSSQLQVSPPLVEPNNLVQAETAPELDETILEILGVDPTQENVYGAEIQKELAIRLEHYATKGLTKESRKELNEQYLVPDNCKLIKAPILNAELKATLTDVIANRDKAIEIKQTQLATAISALAQVLTQLFLNKDKDTELIKTLMDTSRILCDCQFTESMRRRGFVLSSLRKEIKDLLVTSTKIDGYLFGQDLAETLKAAKAINKSSTELKAPPVSKPQVNKKPVPGSTRPLNWKGPFQTRRQQEHQRTKESAPTKQRQSNSSRPLQHRRQHGKRR